MQRHEEPYFSLLITATDTQRNDERLTKRKIRTCVTTARVYPQRQRHGFEMCPSNVCGREVWTMGCYGVHHYRIWLYTRKTQKRLGIFWFIFRTNIAPTKQQRADFLRFNNDGWLGPRPGRLSCYAGKCKLELGVVWYIRPVRILRVLLPTMAEASHCWSV